MVILRLLSIFGFCSLLTFGPLPAMAATHTVTSLADSGAGTLRQALIDANNGDTINFSVTGAITLTSDSLTVGNDLTIIGPGSGLLAINGNGVHRVLVVLGGATATVSDLTLTNGSGLGGCGLYNLGDLTVNRCLISGNTGMLGGGVYQGGGTLTMTDCTISGNTASASIGGGIYANGGTLSLVNCTISGNTAKSSGGGIYSGVNLSLTNCTVSGNTVPSGVEGGAGFHQAGGTLTLDSCTVTDNSTDQKGGGIYNSDAVVLKNTIISNNSAASGNDDCLISAGTITSNGNNLVGSATDCSCNQATDIANADPGLRALADNGGYTKTHALEDGSQALDAGSTSANSDQRGECRPRNYVDDIGAFERQYGDNPCQVDDPSVQGGPTDRFGAPPDLIPLSLTDPVTPLTCPLTRTASIPYSSDPGLVPGLIFRWTGPDGAGQNNWLPIDGGGTMANGIAWTTSLRDYYGRSIVDLTYTLPDGFCDGLEPGRYTVEYRLRTGNDGDSNPRREFFDYGDNVSAARTGRTRSDEEIVFKLMVSRYNPSSRQLNRIPGGAVKFSQAETVLYQEPLTAGLAEISLTKGQPGKLIIEPDGEEAITFKISYSDGLLCLTNRCSQTGTAYGPATIDYYRQPDGAYAIEYYRNKIYITNQADSGGPISGLVYRAP